MNAYQHPGSIECASSVLTSITLFMVIVAAGHGAAAQGLVTAREVAPVDLTGYWTAVVTEDWRWRMVTPPRGDYASMPLSDEGRSIADGWDPAAEGDTCKVYGAAGVMRMPLRVHIAWAGWQYAPYRYRSRHADTPAALRSRRGGPGRTTRCRGHSTAHWGRENIGFDREDWQEADVGATLKATTTHLSPGFLRRNGIPYGSETVMTEYFIRHAAYGEEWFTVTTVVSDPRHLTQEFITSSSFKRLPDGFVLEPGPLWFRLRRSQGPGGGNARRRIEPAGCAAQD